MRTILMISLFPILLSSAFQCSSRQTNRVRFAITGYNPHCSLISISPNKSSPRIYKSCTKKDYQSDLSILFSYSSSNQDATEPTIKVENVTMTMNDDSGIFSGIKKEKIFTGTFLSNDETTNNNKEDVDVYSSSLGSGNSKTSNAFLSSFTSVLLLNLVAVIWGTQHAVIKSVLMGTESMDITNSGFTFSRFLLAVLVVINYTPNIQPFLQWSKEQVDDILNSGIVEKEKSVDISSDLVDQKETEASIMAWRWGSEMGLWMFLGYAFQAIGLAFTTAQRSGFLLYLNVKFVPFFACVLLSRQITIPTWVSAFVAFSGTALLTFGDSSQPPFNIGDVWSIAAAMASAMFILRMEKASSEVQDSASLNSACVWTVTFFAFIWTVLEGGIASIPMDFSMSDPISSLTPIIVGAIEFPITSVMSTFQASPFAMLYLGIIATALTNYIQASAQQNISAERASIIYAMDPVYGAFFSYLLLGEVLGLQGMVGAGLITFAAATNAFLDLAEQKTEEDVIDENDFSKVD